MGQLDLDVDAKSEVQRKSLSAAQAAGLVESGDLVWIPSGHQPPAILALLATREKELRNVTIRSPHIPDMGWFREDAREAWDLQVQYALAADNRQALADRVADYHPFSMINQHKAADTRADAEGRPIDDLLLVVTPPDEQGWMCVGNACWDAVSSARRARRVLVETSDALPRTCGDTWLHVSQVEAIVEGDRPRLGIPEPDPASFPDLDRQIASHVKTLVKDGDTVQIGVGKHTMALALLGAFDDCNDLGFFAELTVPGMVNLARRGIINCRRAEVAPNKFVACFMGNSLEDLELIERNPFFELRSYEHTNDPMVIARHENMLTLNGALSVDLSGQIGVCALGPRVYSGTGGQLAYHLGAFLSKRGRAVTVLPSTARSGAVSTITAQFPEGQIISIPREFADTVVTEHGVARLLGRSVRERAEELISIAHPDHREHLRAEAQRLYYP
ncbi:MAG: acetyl-CoA hydrolase/transferase family protein [Deltaproteobacteria bacterium]|nr:acetyl-CoA hydrolase/transferase family protein [Deltaproteobacteria bacterium]MBW2361232.1 acetyl-CoA hydrolase/transferase family protein [Deltaproteobacteria bacterium]